MGIFSRDSRDTGGTTVATLIAKGCYTSGQLKVEGDIQVDGVIEGQCNVQGTLIISETGRVKGEIHAERLIVNGIVEGECHAPHMQVLGKGKVNGKVRSNDLCIEPGGKFIGENSELPGNEVVQLNSTNEIVDKSPATGAKKTTKTA